MTQELQQLAFSRESIEMLDAMGLGPVWLLRDSMDPLVPTGLCGLPGGRSPHHRNDLLCRHGLNSLQQKREVSRRLLNPLGRHRLPQLLRLYPRQLHSRRSA